jgi:protein-tyrosine phosphatase
MSGYGKKNNNNLSVNTSTPRRRPSLKRSLSFEIPSPTHVGSGPGSWSTYYDSNLFNQDRRNSSQQLQKQHNYSNSNNNNNIPNSSKYAYNSSRAPRGGRNSYSKNTNPSVSSSSVPSSSFSSKRKLKKASTWHPNLTEQQSSYADVYADARKIKNAQKAFDDGGGTEQLQSGLNSSNKTCFTYQLNLTWSQAENLISSYQVINVNPLYYSANESPPKQPCMKKWMRGCDSIEVELDGPSFVTDTLFLGDRHDASDRRKMIDYGITHVVNATRDIDNFFEGQIVGGRKIKYMNVPINDAENVDIMKYFGQTNKFLLSCVRNGGRALIHCRAGVCRSTTILTAFLMYFETWRLVPTLRYLRECRFIIHPNDDFKQQLVLYELLMFGKSSVKPYLATHEWGMYKLRALLNRSGIESWLPERGNLCAIQ